jgi:hypothetical protein
VSTIRNPIGQNNTPTREEIMLVPIFENQGVTAKPKARGSRMKSMTRKTSWRKRKTQTTAQIAIVRPVLVQSVAPKTKIESVITDDAVAMLGEKLSTPLQFEYYLTRALEEAYKVGQKPVGADMIENVLAKDINGLEPRLTRQGYNAKVLAELLNAKPREIKSFLSGQLASGRPRSCRVNC